MKTLAAIGHALLTPNGLKALAVLLLGGGGIAATAIAAWALYLVKEDAERAFWLGVAAHVQIALVMTGLLGMLVKRRIAAKIGGNTFEISDHNAAKLAAVLAEGEAEERGHV